MLEKLEAYVNRKPDWSAKHRPSFQLTCTWSGPKTLHVCCKYFHLNRWFDLFLLYYLVYTYLQYVVLPWKIESVNRGRYTYKNVCTMYGHILSWLITFLCHFIYCLIKIGRSFLLLTYGSFHHISVITCTIYINNINNISNVNFNDTVEIILTLNYCNNVKWILMNRIRVKRGSNHS